jgi:hypothetical protein
MKKAIKFTLLLSIAICIQLFFIAPIAKAEQKTYMDNEVNISKKDLIILLEKISGNLGSDIADIGNYANADEEYIKRSVEKLKGLNIIDEHVSFANLYESPKKEEVYYLLAKYIGIEAAEGKTAFIDDEKLQSWSRGYIKELENLGVIEGKDKSFEPGKVLNRGELRDVIKELFLTVINTSQNFRADENNKSKAFIVVNTNDAVIENIKIQTPILINQKASNGRLRIINSDISKIYIAAGSQNFEVQLSNSKLQSAKSLGKNISYTNLGPDGKVGPLPNPEEYKPEGGRSVKRIIKGSRSNGSSDSYFGGNNQKENKAQSDKETEEKVTPQNKDTAKPEEKTGAGKITENKKTQSEVLPKVNEVTPNKGEKNSAKENLSEDFIVLNEHLYADKTLKYKAVNGVTLEDKALIGLKLSGENNGVKLNVKWEGESLNQVKNAQKGEYRLAVSSLEDLVINDKNYGKVKFIVKIIIE